jgi:hypothetical protein
VVRIAAGSEEAAELAAAGQTRGLILVGDSAREPRRM